MPDAPLIINRHQIVNHRRPPPQQNAGDSATHAAGAEQCVSIGHWSANTVIPGHQPDAVRGWRTDRRSTGPTTDGRWHTEMPMTWLVVIDAEVKRPSRLAWRTVPQWVPVCPQSVFAKSVEHRPTKSLLR